jgi:acetyl-CoA carboxylase biotin carboxyl carrier protein
MPGKRAKKQTGGRGQGGGPRTPAAGSDRLAQLERLIELMVQRDVVEVELEDAGTRWRVRRKEEPAPLAFAAPATMAMPGALAPPSGAGAAAAMGAPVPEAPQGEVFKSPMLGTFYRAASPEAEPFVKEGDRVGADTTLCIIEAMKVMNEIKAEREFEVVEILVRNGDPVEYGQPLFTIRS